MKHLLLAGVLAVSCLTAQEPDNTKTNKRDNTTGAVTADQQKMNPSDRELARKIRKSVYDDKSLSTYAHNVKIIVRDGAVTLRGPVRTAEEKDSVASKATTIAGASKVTNELEIAPEKK
jgi:hyperosmotically inducible periplasmic protein